MRIEGAKELTSHDITAIEVALKLGAECSNATALALCRCIRKLEEANERFSKYEEAGGKIKISDEPLSVLKSTGKD